MICNVKLVRSQARLAARQTNVTPAENSKLEEDIQKVIKEIHSLSAGNTRNFAIPLSEEPLNLNMYYSILSNLNSLFQPLMNEGFFDDLPKILVCLLSERQDCGLMAELTKAVSLEMAQPLLMFFSSLKSQTCTPLTTEGETRSFFGTYLNIGDTVTAAFSGFQQMFINMLSNLTLSENLTKILSSLLDSLATNVLHFTALFLETPLDYVRIALEFGIEVPSPDEQDTCKQGDLKQLIMWGLKHNVSWSFGMPLVDILLETFLPSECLIPSSLLFQRSAPQLNNHTYVNYEITCDHHNLAALNDTLCADVLMGLGNGSSLITFCQALSSLSSSQLALVWSNMCYIFQALFSPLVSKSSDCVVGDAQPSAVSSPLNESQLVSPSALRRVAREVSSLRQLACDYSSWVNNTVDAVLVTFCSENDQMQFVGQVCNNASLMKKLLSDQKNRWLYAFCSNFSAGAAYLVNQFCMYEQWLNQPAQVVDSALLQFCFSFDAPRLTSLICEHTGFLMLLISNPDNWPLMPNCSGSSPPLFTYPELEPDYCQYSEWHDVMQITTDILSKCIRVDQSGFAREVCQNKTFLNSLLQNKEIAWLESHCSTSMVSPPPGPTPSFNLAAWCDYHNWAEKWVDDSVVGLCWQNDQVSFQENVCCKTAVFEKLLENPLNKWLTSVCTDLEEITMTPEVCTYSDWTRPIIVDMTDLALCAEIDQQNFTSKVCTNSTVLQNLLANQDNAWLIRYCGNYSVIPTPGGQTIQPGINATEQCLYSNWITSLPNAKLLVHCWEKDQANFISSICPNVGVLLFLSREPSTAWVSNICTAYTNYTTTNNSTTTKPNDCASQTLIKQFSFMCPQYFIPDCKPCPSQNTVLQMIVRCWVERLNSRMEDLLTTPVTEVLNRAVAATVVILLAVEDSMGPIWQVNNAIEQSTLTSVVDYLQREINQDRKKVLLQCFGTVLSRLLETSRDKIGIALLLIKEYLSLPLRSVQPVLAAAHINTIRVILQYYNSFKGTIQLSKEYQSTMVSVILKTHLAADNDLLLDLGSLLVAVSPDDIKTFPSLQNNVNLWETINANLDRMSLAQQEAFGLWYSKILSPSNITRGQQSLIGDTGNLIAYLPFHLFQHLSAAQLLDGLDVLQRNTLSPLKQDFIANKLIRTYRNMTAQDLMRLGDLLCLAEAQDLLVYKNTEVFQVIQENIMNCTLSGLSVPSQLVSDLLLSNPEFKIPSSLSPDRLKEIAPLLPLLSVTFLNGLTTSQLLSALPALSTVPFTPTQASIIMDKLLTNARIPVQLEELGSLIVGVKTETLLSLTSDKLLSALKVFAQHTPARCRPYMSVFCAPEANAIATKLWGFPEVVSWLDDVEPLLRWTPLICILPRTPLLVKNLSNTATKPWKTQQAQAIVKAVNTYTNQIKQNFLSLGTLSQGVSCQDLHQLLQADRSPSFVRKILALLRQQPGLLHTALKRCVIEELYPLQFFADLLQDLGAEIALCIPMDIIRLFPAEMMGILKKMIVASPQYFLMLTRIQQEILVDKIIQRMNMYTGPFTEEEFRSLDILAPFVADEVFVQVDRSFFAKNLDYLQRLCYSSSKMEIVARILQEPAVFGPVTNWTQDTLSVVGRFLFFLPSNVLQDLPLSLMTVGRVEKLFMSQRQWEDGDVGILCSDTNERKDVFSKQQFVLQFFLGFLKMNSLSLSPIVPTCEILRTTAPSAWTSSSFSSMSSSAFSNCLELIGQDPFLASYQRTEILKRVKKMYGPASSFSQSVIAQLGGIAVELSPEELSTLRLTERRSISALGALNTWNKRQLTALFTAVLNSTKLTPSKLDSSMLVALGHIVCGAQIAEINTFNNVEFSKAVLWLGKLNLSCSEEQMGALVGLLTNSLAFGLMSSWGTDVFIEIGALAAGLPDIVMSSLVKEQIEGISPMAMSMIPPKKFSVVFHQDQINMFTYEQAYALTPQQRAALTDVQKRAVDMVLTCWKRNIDLSAGLAQSHSPLCIILGLLMVLAIRF
ncbi:stereocilin [Poecilia latipinna]|uniref:stereocilin n=1 Tax=Poecilia latipinna TaxID=48699 RepID=UPI00072E6650|nr:PREDICTED: stereocilin [Poecilia latipinna]